MVTAIVSVMTGIPTRRDVAMTDEITLRPPGLSVAEGCRDLTMQPRRRYVVTIDSDHDGPIFPNLAKEVTPTEIRFLSTPRGAPRHSDRWHEPVPSNAPLVTAVARRALEPPALQCIKPLPPAVSGAGCQSFRPPGRQG